MIVLKASVERLSAAYENERSWYFCLLMVFHLSIVIKTEKRASEKCKVIRGEIKERRRRMALGTGSGLLLPLKHEWCIELKCILPTELYLTIRRSRILNLDNTLFFRVSGPEHSIPYNLFTESSTSSFINIAECAIYKTINSLIQFLKSLIKLSRKVMITSRLL